MTLTDREEAMKVILEDTLEDLNRYIENQDLPEDCFLERFPIARIEQYLERLENAED